MIHRVLETIQKHNLIGKGDTVLVGVSGGPDSVCLLHLLDSLKEDFNIKIVAGHVNHCLRGQESLEDEQYVRALCGRLGIPIHVNAVDVGKVSKEKGISLEEAGREVRYGQFDKWAERTGAQKIAVAHHKNDQVETVLMRIIRGTGLDGLRGIHYKRGSIIRPLLDIGRAEIEDYCQKHLLYPRIDRSNLQSIYTRNKVRLELIPYIYKSFGTNVSESIYRMALLIQDDSEYIEGMARKGYQECLVERKAKEVVLDIRQMKENHRALVKRILRIAVQEVKGDLNGIENVHIEDVFNLMLKGKTGSTICLPCNIRAYTSYDLLKVFEDEGEEPFAGFNCPIAVPGITFVEDLGYSIRASIENEVEDIAEYTDLSQDAQVQVFDYEKLKMGINIRSRNTGDIFKPYKSRGTKKLKEYFIDCKIPRDVRDRIPLVAKGNEIVWIIGYKTSDKFKVTENTKSMLKLIYTGGTYGGGN